MFVSSTATTVGLRAVALPPRRASGRLARYKNSWTGNEADVFGAGLPSARTCKREPRARVSKHLGDDLADEATGHLLAYRVIRERGLSCMVCDAVGSRFFVAHRLRKWKRNRASTQMVVIRRSPRCGDCGAIPLADELWFTSVFAPVFDTIQLRCHV